MEASTLTTARGSFADGQRPARVAALLACHNRKPKTLQCLQTLLEGARADGVDVDAHVVDAGSTDGTDEAIAEQFPGVRLIRRDDSLFWCGGMRVAFQEAMDRESFDYYLWLNDDTVLLPGTIGRLVRTAREVRHRHGADGIIVGSCRHPETGRRTYGGLVQLSRFRPLGFLPVEPGDEPKRCCTFDGNCVLVPHAVAQVVGNLSGEFTHAIGDTDYGLRAKARGIASWVAPGYAATCMPNLHFDRCFDPALPLRSRLKILRSPKGMPPKEWGIFARRHAPLQWPVYWASLYARALFPRFWSLLRRARSWARPAECRA